MSNIEGSKVGLILGPMAWRFHHPRLLNELIHLSSLISAGKNFLSCHSPFVVLPRLEFQANLSFVDQGAYPHHLPSTLTPAKGRTLPRFQHGVQTRHRDTVAQGLRCSTALNCLPPQANGRRVGWKLPSREMEQNRLSVPTV